MRTHYLTALAHNQNNRRLKRVWFGLCDKVGRGRLPEAYLDIGLMGLRLLPTPDGSAPIAEEAEGLARWADHLDQNQDSRDAFDLQWQAFKEFHDDRDWRRAAAPLYGRYAKRPFAAWWRDDLAGAAPTNAGLIREPSRDDTFRIFDEIRRLPWNATMPKVERFVAEQERYAQASESAYTLSRAFNVLGNAVLRMENRPEALPLAERLAVMVLDHDANNEPSWVLWSKALRRMGRVQAADAVLWRACRFMQDKVHIRTILAETMESEGRIAEAEALYRDTIKRFRTDDVAPNALAKLLADNGRPKEAEALYRDTVERFPNDPVCRLDLGLLLLDLKRPLAEVQPLLDDLVRLRASEANTLRRHMDAAQRDQPIYRQHDNRTGRVDPQPRPVAEQDPDWTAFIVSGNALHAEFLLSPVLSDKNLLLMTPEKRDDLRETAKTMLRAAIKRAPNNPVVRLIAARYPDVIAKTIDADTARRVAGGDFGLRLELALRDKDEEALGYLFEDFHDPGQQAVAACGWLWLNPDSGLPGADEAAEHLHGWLAKDVPTTALPALVHIHDELRERLPFWSRDADRNGFLESWDSLQGDKPRRAQVRALIDVALLGLILAEIPMLADLPLAA